MKEQLAADWRVDLRASRDVAEYDKKGFEFFLAWFEKWRLGGQRPPGRRVAEEFWRTKVKEKPRKDWQLEQWAEAMAWYLRWLKICEESGREVRGVPERMKAAVESVAAWQGLARRTRKAYCGWAARYGVFAGEARRAIDQEVAREFLSQFE